MPNVMIFIQFLQDPNGPHVELLRQAGLEVRFPPRPDITDEEENVRVLQGISATIAGGEPYSRRVMAALPDLRVISRWGVGVDRVDLEAATGSNAVVTITPSANHEAVAEHAVALLLAVSRFLVQRNAEIHQGLWERRCALPLREKTLGLVGLGRIGRSVAVRAEAFRMRLLAHEAFPDREFARRHGIELVDLDTLLARSDYVTLHVPLTEETRGLINRRTLSRMKPGALLINTSRGGLVVEEDLVDALKSGHLGGAGLDVFLKEPIQPDHPLLELDNVLVSDHTAGIDTRSVEAMAVEAARNIVELYRGGWPAAAVANPAVRQTWKW